MIIEITQELIDKALNDVKGTKEYTANCLMAQIYKHKYSNFRCGWKTAHTQTSSFSLTEEETDIVMFFDNNKLDPDKLKELIGRKIELQ